MIIEAADRETVYYGVDVKTDKLGFYEFEVEAKEKPSNEVLPIVGKQYFPVTVAKFICEVDNTPPSATYGIRNKTKVDVVFALGQLRQMKTLDSYLNTFTNNIGAAANNIDIRVEAVSTSELNLESSINWVEDINQTIGNITITNGGTSVEMIGNRSLMGKNALYTMANEGVSGVHIEFDYSVDFGDSFYYAAFIFNLKKVKIMDYTEIAVEEGEQVKYEESGLVDAITGYMVLFPKYTGSVYFYLVGEDGTRSDIRVPWNYGIYKITYILNENENRMKEKAIGDIKYLERIQMVDMKKSGRLILDIDQETISVSGSGTNEEVTVNLPEIYGNGIGFMAEHYAHGCSNIGKFDIRNIVLSYTQSKSMGEALTDVNWRDGAERFIVHATDVIPEDLNAGNEGYIYTLTKMINSNAYLVNIGNSINRSALIAFGNRLTTPRGKELATFIRHDSPDITKGLDQAADWILDKVKSKYVETDWILVDTDVVWGTHYSDLENDVPLNFGEHDGIGGRNATDKEFAQSLGIPLTKLFKDSKVFAEKWRFRHDFSFYDNSSNLIGENNVWLDNPISIFKYPGKYRVNYKRRDNPLYNNVNLSHIFDNYRYWSIDYDPQK